MASTNIKCIQINLHHAKGASSILSRRVVKDNIDVSFIQEPWVAGGRIKGLSTQSYKLIYNTEHERPRAALLVHKRLRALPVPEFIFQNQVAVMVELQTAKGKQKAIFASAYFPSEMDAPPPEGVK